MPLNNWENFGTKILIYDIKFCNYGRLSRVDSKWMPRTNLHFETTFCSCGNSYRWWFSGFWLGTNHIFNWISLGVCTGLPSKLHTWDGIANDSEKIWWELNPLQQLILSDIKITCKTSRAQAIVALIHWQVVSCHGLTSKNPGELKMMTNAPFVDRRTRKT